MLTTSPQPTRSTHTRRFKLLHVYAVVIRVLLSYGFLKFAGFFRGPEWISRKSIALHRKNARRVEQMILRVKGLFIKVGQLISILTNFLPEEFREGLEGQNSRSHRPHS